MRIGPKNGKMLLMFVFFCLLAAFSVVAFEDGEPVYSALDRAFYQAPGETVWIRAGLHINIIDVNIPSDNRPQVTFRITDDQGQGLDKDGKLTPGTVSLSFIMAYLPSNGTQYIDYSTRVQGPSPISGKTATQAATDSGGTYTVLGDGNYTYKFKTVLPSNYDKTATHTLGMYSNRNLTEFGLSRYVANVTKNFVPNGSQPVKIRNVVSDAACNQCHDPLSAHGTTGRQDVEICILCHTPQTIDPDTGNTVDMKVMVHKIHRGKNLPSVIAGKPYQIVGNAQSVADFSKVAFPQDPRNCDSCHQDAIQANNYLFKPSRDVCGACHDDINWETGENHPAGPQLNDSQCAICHIPQGELEYDASIAGAHTIPFKSTQLKNPKYQILGITNKGPGQKPSVQFKITDKNGNDILPSAMSRLSLMIGGPTSDYRWTLRETATGATVANGVATYNFTGALPATATGSYAVEIEGYINATLNPGTTQAISVRDAGENVVVPFAVTDTVATPRRAVVDIAKCNSCHDHLQLHGSNRNQISACVICHNPAATTAATATLPGESIDMKIMVHKIHTGEELAGDYILGSTNFNEVLYPGDRRDCLRCHVGTSYTVPLPASVTSSTTPRGYWDPTRPTAAACLGCHDSLEAAVHALVNTASFGESCSVCHKESADFSVSQSHAR